MNFEPYLANFEKIESNNRKKSAYEIKLMPRFLNTRSEDLQQIDPKRLFHESPGIRRSALRVI